MRIGIISDIHVDTYSLWNDLTDVIAETTLDNGAEILLVCGDITNDIRLFESFFRYLSSHLLKNNTQILVVPGNHDVWVYKPENPVPNSKEKYYEVIPRVLSKLENIHYLPIKPFIKEGHAFVGSMGWYDYSYIQNYGKVTSAIRKSLDKYWSDKKYIWWGEKQASTSEDNIRILDEMLLGLKTQLFQVKTCKDITVCLHMVPKFDFCRRSSEMDLLSAYMGTEKLYDLIVRYKNVRRVVFGHTHYTCDSTQNDIRFINASIGLKYQNKNKHMSVYVRERMKFIDI